MARNLDCRPGPGIGGSLAGLSAVRWKPSARANDRYDVTFVVVAAACATGGNCAGNLVALYFMESRGSREGLGLAICAGRGRAALVPGGEAPIDAIAIGIV